MELNIKIRLIFHIDLVRIEVIKKEITVNVDQDVRKIVPIEYDLSVHQGNQNRTSFKKN